MSRDTTLPLGTLAAVERRTEADADASRWLPWALAAIVLLGYPLALAANHTEGEDSGHYIEVVRDANLAELFYPNHVLFASFNWVVYQAWQWGGYTGDAALPMQLLNVLAAAACVLLLFRLARQLGADDLHAVLGVALTAVCYGFWWYSVEAETYLLPLPFILGCVAVLIGIARHGFAARRLATLGVLFSLAVLFHQQHVLLMPILIATLAAVWFRRRKEVRLRTLVSGLAVFGVVSAVLVGGVYLTVAFVVHDCTSFGAAVAWSKGTAQNGLWSIWSWSSPVKSLLGIGRAVCGLHFLYGLDAFCDAIGKIRPGAFLADDRFLAESISPPVRWLCLGAAALAGMAGLMVATACVLPRRCKTDAAAGTNHARFAFGVFATGTFVVYGVFNTLWEPQNIEFWVMLIPLAALAVTLRLGRSGAPRWATPAAVTLVAALFVANLLGSVLPQTTRRGDYWYAANARLIGEARAEDLIVTDGGWISDNCLRSNTTARVAVVRELPATRLAEIIDSHRGGRIFISSWALEPDPAIVATSPDWNRDEAALSQLFGPMRERLIELDDNGSQAFYELLRVDAAAQTKTTSPERG